MQPGPLWRSRLNVDGHFPTAKIPLERKFWHPVPKVPVPPRSFMALRAKPVLQSLAGLQYFYRHHTSQEMQIAPQPHRPRQGHGDWRGNSHLPGIMKGFRLLPAPETISLPLWWRSFSPSSCQPFAPLSRHMIRVPVVIDWITASSRPALPGGYAVKPGFPATLHTRRKADLGLAAQGRC